MLGLPKSGKSTIINQIRTMKWNHAEDNLIRSQYELYGAIITEMTAQNVASHAVRNIHYFPVLKDELTSSEMPKPKSNGNTTWQRKTLKMKRREKLQALYRRLSHFTKKELDNEVSKYSIIRSSEQIRERDNMLCFGFIRPAVGNLTAIPFDIMALIRKYVKKLRVDSYKFQYDKYDNKLYSLWECDAMESRNWCCEPREGLISGIMFIIDLSSYCEYFVDGNGERKNKLEYALSVLRSYNENNVQCLALKTVCLTKKDVFEEMIKHIPPTRCPLFSDTNSQKGIDILIEEVKESVSDPCGATDVLCVNQSDDQFATQIASAWTTLTRRIDKIEKVKWGL